MKDLWRLCHSPLTSDTGSVPYLKILQTLVFHSQRSPSTRQIVKAFASTVQLPKSRNPAVMGRRPPAQRTSMNSKRKLACCLTLWPDLCTLRMRCLFESWFRMPVMHWRNSDTPFIQPGINRMITRQLIDPRRFLSKRISKGMCYRFRYDRRDTHWDWQTLMAILSIGHWHRHE